MSGDAPPSGGARDPRRDEHVFIPERPGLDTLAQLVMDLSAQLHVERQARLALQEALMRRGAVTREEIDGLAGDADFLAEARAGLGRSMDRLVRIMTEAGDHMGPLRAESPTDETRKS